MINEKIFIDRQLFPIQIKDYLSSAKWDNKILLYSPLAHSFVVIENEQLYVLAAQLEHNGRFDDEELNRKMIESVHTPLPNYVTSPNDVFAITILPNNICNFSCSYCYAAKGHGKDEISKEKLKTVIDFFINPQRINRKDLYISFGGGGEPLLSWDKVLYAIEYSDKLAKKHGFNIHFSYASNGSIMTDKIIEAIHLYNIKVNVSFDILEDIQTQQRKNYHQVCKTLKILTSNGVSPTINSVITPLNVALQCEMVGNIHVNFPGLHRLSFDYVVDGKLFDNPKQLRDFFNQYTYHFFKARTLGEKYGISVSSIKHHNLSQLKTRACQGGFDLTPTGELSLCFFVSSPKESLYNDFIYGKVNSNTLEFDYKKFKSVINNSYNCREDCQKCFIRWHCGGGCLFHTKTYSEKMLAEMCTFQRRFSIISLLNDAKQTNVLNYEDSQPKQEKY